MGSSQGTARLGRQVTAAKGVVPQVLNAVNVGFCRVQYAQIALSAVLFCAVCRAQEQPSESSAAQQKASENQASEKVAKPCQEPPPLLRWEDYQGPFQKIVGSFARTLERKSVRSPHYKPGTVLCSLEWKDKFLLFVHDSYEPLPLLTAGFNAAIDQAENNDRKFGQGAQGYGRRFGANLADQASRRFFTEFAYPVIFSEDPRYYRLGHGTKRARLLHAVGHTFVAYRDNAKPMFNYSEWLGTTSAVVLGSTYHTSGDHGFAPMARSVGYFAAQDLGFDVLREFWPEIAHKLKMPFRDTREAPTESRY